MKGSFMPQLNKLSLLAQNILTKNTKEMIQKFFNKVCFFMLLIIPVTVHAQKDVTQFLGIPVDGFKNQMIEKLQSKGFLVNRHIKDALDGEFNGTNVRIYIGTNNNKVCRIMVADAYEISETDIKIRFNKLLQQFQNNKNYYSSDFSKNSIPEDEDISYELLVKNKRYEAIFFQKPADYDSLNLEMKNIYQKETINDGDNARLNIIKEKMLNFNKSVWFMISERNGKYYISMFYDNKYNTANGESL
jgi:hypothetical protein